MALDLAALDGLQQRGGCEHCTATQTIQAHYYGPDIHRLLTEHDDRCPWLKRQQRRAHRTKRHRHHP